MNFQTIYNKNNNILLKKIPPNEDNSVENCNGILFGHMTTLDQSESTKTNNDHVTHKVNTIWPIRSLAILHMCFCLDEVINDITTWDIPYISKVKFGITHLIHQVLQLVGNCCLVPVITGATWVVEKNFNKHLIRIRGQHNTLNSAYNEKKYAEILLRYRQLFVKGDVFIGE